MKRNAKWMIAGLATLTLGGILTGTLPMAAMAASHQQELVLYSAQGYDMAMGAAFQKATGIKTVVSDMSTGPVISKVEAERANPHWDVVWYDGDSSMQSLDDQGLLLKGFTPNDFNNYTALGKSLVPADHAYFPGGVTAAAAFAYNPKVLPAKDVPTTLQGLLSPQFKNEIAMNDPSISGPTYPFVAGVMQQMGLAKGKQFFLNLKKNGLHIYRTNKVTLSALLHGRAKLIWIQDSAITAAIQQGDPIAVAYPKSGTYTLPDVIGIDKYAPDMAVAKRFVEFVLSKQGQEVMINPQNGGGDSFYNPVIKGIRPNPLRKQSGINWVRVNPIQAANVENSVKAWFNTNITY